MTITVHHLDRSRSHRVLFLLEEMGIPYGIRFYRRDAKTLLAPESLKAVHPLGKSPVVTDDGLVLAETGHIVTTLIDRHAPDGPLRPSAGTPACRRYDYYLHYAEGSLMPLVLTTLVLGHLPERLPLPLRPLGRMIAAGAMRGFVRPQLRLHLCVLEEALAGSAFLAGDTLTGADAMMSFPVQAIRARAGLRDYPRLSAWLVRLEARPAWTRAVAKGGALDLSFQGRP